MGSVVGKKEEGVPPVVAPPRGSPAYEVAAAGGSAQYANYSYGQGYYRGSSSHCPYCGEAVGWSFHYCPQCGREMPALKSRALFDLIDANGDGIITRDELDHALGYWGHLANTFDDGRVGVRNYSTRYTPRVASAYDWDDSGIHYSSDVIYRNAGGAPLRYPLRSRSVGSTVHYPEYPLYRSSSYVGSRALLPSYRSASPTRPTSYQLVRKRYAVDHGLSVPISREIMPSTPVLGRSLSYVPPVAAPALSYVPPVTAPSLSYVPPVPRASTSFVAPGPVTTTIVTPSPYPSPPLMSAPSWSHPAPPVPSTTLYTPPPPTTTSVVNGPYVGSSMAVPAPVATTYVL